MAFCEAKLFFSDVSMRSISWIILVWWFRVSHPNCINTLIHKVQGVRTYGHLSFLIHNNILFLDYQLWMTCNSLVNPPMGGGGGISNRRYMPDLTCVVFSYQQVFLFSVYTTTLSWSGLFLCTFHHKYPI